MYLGWSDEKRKIIEAQWCVNTIWWEINNFLFYTLTSKNLRLSESEVISPEYYIVEFTWWDSNYCSNEHMCDKINLSYSTEDTPENMTIYKTLKISSTCQQTKQPIKFFRSWLNVNYIIMNKWFSPKSITNKEVFYLSWNEKKLVWDIIIWLCLNSECSSPKEISKFVADARSQTISSKNCKYYDKDDPTKCKTREWCNVYDSSDPTKCEKY